MKTGANFGNFVAVLADAGFFWQTFGAVFGLYGWQTVKIASRGILHKLQDLCPIFIGVVSFCLLAGMAPLDPANLDWLFAENDPVQAWLGWSFFRNSPWTWPPGLNPDYGLELGNSLIYTDSIPLLAIPFKLFRAFLPPVFQYFGWWLLASLVLQAWFAWKLLGLFLKGFWPPLLGSLLFVFTPILIVRLPVHMTLVGQFWILASLYLTLKPEPARFHWHGWVLLLFLSAMCHAYIFFMCAALWGSDLLARLCAKELSAPRFGLNIVEGLMAGALGCYLAGYFAISPGGAGGFAMYKMNLLSIFDSDGDSYIIKDIPTHPGEGEGYSFLGAGSLLLLAIAAGSLCIGRVRIYPLLKRYWPLLLACLLLAALAMTNKIGIGLFELELPRPASWERWLQPVFRASGRFFWPVHYLLILASIYILFRSWPHKFAMFALAFAVVLQIGDGSKRWRPIAPAIASARYESPMRSLFWSELPYRKIRIIPLQNARSDWKPIGMFAALRGLPTNAVYVSRTDDLRLAAINQADARLIESGSFEPDTLYILDEETFGKVRGMVPGALLENIDGFYVLAPHYFKRIKNGSK